MKKAARYSFLDQFIITLDDGIRNAFTHTGGERKSPGHQFKEDPIKNDTDLKKQSAALMRVNHVGEVCAQALYQGQALTSHSSSVRSKMQEAAKEEVDHLNWCHERLQQLDSHTSYLNPVWYLGSLSIGVAAGLAGDKWSLGFLAETEHQVVKHLESHMDKLPREDTISQAIVQQMREDEAKHAAIEDEARHAAMAIEEGASELPEPIKSLMALTSKVMTKVAARI